MSDDGDDDDDMKIEACMHNHRRSRVSGDQDSIRYRASIHPPRRERAPSALSSPSVLPSSSTIVMRSGCRMFYSIPNFEAQT
ncbi:hypothetical protein EVAR_42526_1 [Eumeta japonica]|uniref:Uncharacterized protein n=1 Tax=Eumeta variegata TaxID=151549 RepID=A0A4C1XIW1_EUMVA|nr:hypothetical protein EVAR_42526_1 [Eumeta japonica]